MPEGLIPNPEEGIISSSLISPDVALISSEIEAPEVRVFNISFAKYNHKACQIHTMDVSNAKGTLDILCDVGMNFQSMQNYRQRAKFEIKHVVNSGDYSKLYKGMGPDMEVHEIKYQHQAKGIDIRVFFSVLETERIFYIIAARYSHVDTSKVRHRS